MNSIDKALKIDVQKQKKPTVLIPSVIGNSYTLCTVGFFDLVYFQPNAWVSILLKSQECDLCFNSRLNPAEDDVKLTGQLQIQ